MIQYLVIGKRWFDKTYGNTYHTVKIRDVTTGETIIETPMQYGYGDHYRQTAYFELVKMGLVKEEDYNNHALNRERFIYEVVDVQRKRDL